MMAEEYSWKGKKNIDREVSKDLKLGLLKQMIEKMGNKLPNIVPPEFEDLQYEESRFLYKLKVDLNYVYQIEDHYAETSPSRQFDPDIDAKTGHFDPIGGYRGLVNRILNLLIILCEADSFYRFRIKHLINFVESDLLRTHYFQLIRRFNMEEKWTGKILDIRLRPFGSRAPSQSIWQHHMDKPIFIKMDEEQKKREENGEK